MTEMRKNTYFDLFKSLFDVSYDFINIISLTYDYSLLYEEFYLYVLEKLDSSPGYMRSYYRSIPITESLLLKYLDQTKVFNLEYFKLDYNLTSKVIYELYIKYTCGISMNSSCTRYSILISPKDNSITKTKITGRSYCEFDVYTDEIKTLFITSGFFLQLLALL